MMAGIGNINAIAFASMLLLCGCTDVASSASGEASDWARTVSSREKVDIFYLPERQIEDRPRDIQLKLKIKRKFLQGRFSWPPLKKTTTIFIMADINSLGPASTRSQDKYPNPKNVFAMAPLVVRKNFIRTRVDPDYWDYRPHGYIGDQPFIGEYLGLRVQENKWLDVSGGPVNEQYSYWEDGKPIVWIICIQTYPKKRTDTRSCSMDFFLSGFDAETANSKYGVGIRVSMNYKHLPEWKAVWKKADAFIGERSEIVPYKDRPSWIERNEPRK